MSEQKMTVERARELDERFPGGWGTAATRADADKLRAGGIGAVNPAGEVWPDHKDDDAEFPEFVTSAWDGALGRVTETDAILRRFRVKWDGGGRSWELLDDGGQGWRPLLTREKAEAGLAVVQRYINTTYGPGWEPKLYEPGHEGPFWNVSLEGAEDWTLRIRMYDETEFPPGVYVEAVNSWCLALYPVE